MGLDKTAAEVLSAARFLGADFSESIMIGRQWLTAPEETMLTIARLHGDAGAKAYASEYAEPFFKALGATSIDSLDVSDLEGANIIHDMNDPIPDELRGRYSLVFDGGTIEHIFNAPQAYRNCMQLLRPGGFFVQVSTGNNFMGHGFWQLSPELLYRIFSLQNGFVNFGVFVQELPHWWRMTKRGIYFLARDPAWLGWRVELRNVWPTYVIVIAKKDVEKDPFEDWPQQSDYVRLWQGDEKHAWPTGRLSMKQQLRKAIPSGLERIIRPPLWNSAYVPIKVFDLMRGRLPKAL